MVSKLAQSRATLFLIALTVGVATLIFIVPHGNSGASAAKGSSHRVVPVRGASHRTPHRVRSAHRAVVATPSASADQQAAFGVLAREATADDRPDAQLRGIAVHATDDGLDVTGARRLEQDASGTVWLIPGRGRLCLGEEPVNGGNLAMSMTCDSNAAAAAKGLAMSVGGEYVGVVPDGSSTITAVGSDGHDAQVSVTGNVYRISPGDYTVRFTDAAGAQQMHFGG
jgi:hypothetical protein